MDGSAYGPQRLPNVCAAGPFLTSNRSRPYEICRPLAVGIPAPASRRLGGSGAGEECCIANHATFAELIAVCPRDLYPVEADKGASLGGTA